MSIRLDVEQFQAAALPVVPVAPLAPIAVSDVADRHIEFLDGGLPGVNHVVVVGRGKDDALAAVGQRAGIGAKSVVGI
jgi:hypothetical protein